MKSRTEFVHLNGEIYLRVYLILCPDETVAQEILVLEKKIIDCIREAME